MGDEHILETSSWQGTHWSSWREHRRGLLDELVEHAETTRRRLVYNWRFRIIRVIAEGGD